MAIGEHEPLAGAHFPNDVLSHFKRPGSKLTQHCNVAGRLSGFVSMRPGVRSRPSSPPAQLQCT
jgi:hypothetical protein